MSEGRPVGTAFGALQLDQLLGNIDVDTGTGMVQAVFLEVHREVHLLAGEALAGFYHELLCPPTHLRTVVPIADLERDVGIGIFFGGREDAGGTQLEAALQAHVFADIVDGHRQIVGEKAGHFSADARSAGEYPVFEVAVNDLVSEIGRVLQMRGVRNELIPFGIHLVVYQSDKNVGRQADPLPVAAPALAGDHFVGQIGVQHGFLNDDTVLGFGTLELMDFLNEQRGNISLEGERWLTAGHIPTFGVIVVVQSGPGEVTQGSRKHVSYRRRRTAVNVQRPGQ